MPMDAVVTETSREWAAACEVQQRFTQHLGPRHLSLGMDTLDYSARCRQIQEVGGNFYEFVPLPDNRMALAVGDASGKGLAAALMIANVQSSLRTAASFTGNNGAATLEAVNRQVYESSLADRYATLFYAVFDGMSRTLRYVNAGHNPPIILRRDGSITCLETGGAPVGMFPDWTYEEGRVQLYPGDLVLAYTDGLIETANPFGEEWGMEGFLKAATENAAQCADDIIRAVFRSMDAFSRGGQTDDATLVVLRVS